MAFTVATFLAPWNSTWFSKQPEPKDTICCHWKSCWMFLLLRRVWKELRNESLLVERKGTWFFLQTEERNEERNEKIWTSYNSSFPLPLWLGQQSRLASIRRWWSNCGLLTGVKRLLLWLYQYCSYLLEVYIVKEWNEKGTKFLSFLSNENGTKLIPFGGQGTERNFVPIFEER